MNKEIEEILDKLYLDFEKAGLTAPEYSDLRDYITNLQNQLEEKTYLYNKLDIESKYIINNLQDRINKAIEIYENRNSIKFKKQRFMEDKDTGDLMYDILKGEE